MQFAENMDDCEEIPSRISPYLMLYSSFVPNIWIAKKLGENVRKRYEGIYTSEIMGKKEDG